MRAFGAQSALDIDRPAAAKTGTTSDWRDNWTVGYTPDRVVGVWVGNADGQPMEAISGVSGAGPLWHDVMLAAHRGLPPRQFARPDGIVERRSAPRAGCCRRRAALPPAASASWPAASRTSPTPAMWQSRSTRSWAAARPAGYPAERVTTRIFRILPPEAESWVVAAGLARVPRDVCPTLATTDQGRTTKDERPAASSVTISSSLVVRPSSVVSRRCSPPRPARSSRSAQACRVSASRSS